MGKGGRYRLLLGTGYMPAADTYSMAACVRAENAKQRHDGDRGSDEADRPEMREAERSGTWEAPVDARWTLRLVEHRERSRQLVAESLQVSW